MKELRSIYKSDMYKRGGYSVELVDDSIYEWNVNLREIDPDSDLYKDLIKFNETNGQDHIVLNFRFKETFPFSPPLVRVVSPVISRMYSLSTDLYKALLNNNFVMQVGMFCQEELFVWNC